MTRPIFDAPLSLCPLCRSSRLVFHDRDTKGITIDRCRDCGVMFMNPQYTEEHLAGYYAAYITPGEQDGHEHRLKKAQKAAALDLVLQYRCGGRFLGVGCGGGLELEMARDLGFEAEGYDVDPDTTREVAGRLGLTVHTGPFGDLELPAASIACIFADQVLEHTRDPAGYLRRFRELLEPDGVLYLGLPNMISPSVLVKTIQGKLGLKHWSRGRHYDTDHHLFHFTPSSLRRLLTREFGFDVLRLAGDPRVEVSPSRYRLVRRHPVLCSRMAVLARPRT